MHLRNEESRLILFYSDIGEKLGLQNECTIEEKCATFGLSLKRKIDEPVKISINDPLYYYKQESIVALYEISRF